MHVITARVVFLFGTIAGPFSSGAIADEPAVNRTIPVSGTGIDLLNGAIVHSKKPTATGVIQRGTEIVELSGDLNGKVLYQVLVQRRALVRLAAPYKRCWMTKPIARDPMYHQRAFDADVIQLCVRWYITYRLSYRDLVEMMAERGVKVARSTIPVGTSWRVDETYIPIKGKWHYLYRAVDKHGKTIDFLLRPDRGIAAAQAFFRKALATQAPRVPRKVTLDGHVPSHRALWLLRREHRCWTNVKVRSCKYLNNIIEQDHRVIKRRCASMTGFKSFVNAAITISGIELAHRIHKLQFSFGRRRQRRGWSRKDEWAMALA
jgi:transposase-like protein